MNSLQVCSFYQSVQDVLQECFVQITEWRLHKGTVRLSTTVQAMRLQPHPLMEWQVTNVLWVTTVQRGPPQPFRVTRDTTQTPPRTLSVRSVRLVNTVPRDLTLRPAPQVSSAPRVQVMSGKCALLGHLIPAQGCPMSQSALSVREDSTVMWPTWRPSPVPALLATSVEVGLMMKPPLALQLVMLGLAQWAITVLYRPRTPHHAQRAPSTTKPCCRLSPNASSVARGITVMCRVWSTLQGSVTQASSVRVDPTPPAPPLRMPLEVPALLAPTVPLEQVSPSTAQREPTHWQTSNRTVPPAQLATTVPLEAVALLLVLKVCLWIALYFL